MRRVMQWMVVLGCLLIGLAMHGRNHQIVHFDYFLGSLDLPLSVLLVGGLVVGALLGLVVSFPLILRQRYRLRRTEAELRRLATPSPRTKPEEPARGA